MSPAITSPLEVPLLRNARELMGFKLRATDGMIGEVKDLYFDDHRWQLRYYVVETGAWLKSRRVLIAPEAIRAPEWDAGILPTELSQRQIRHSPLAGTEPPVSRQYEMDLRQYYGWPFYWAYTYPGAGFPFPNPVSLSPIPHLPRV